MNPKFATKRIHAYLDYPVALSLIATPFLLGLGEMAPFALYLSVATGVAAFLLTLLTDHHLGLIRVVPYSFHLAVDATVGIVFLLAPFALAFNGIDAWYYWVNGFAVMSVVCLHKSDTEANASSS